MDQSLYTLRDARERPVRHHSRDGRVHGLTSLEPVHELLPRILAQAFDRQRDALPVGIDTDDNDLHAVAEAPDRDRVAMRAYELYLERGGSEGQELDDWLMAERELSSSHGRNSE